MVKANRVVTDRKVNTELLAVKLPVQWTQRRLDTPAPGVQCCAEGSPSCTPHHAVAHTKTSQPRQSCIPWPGSQGCTPAPSGLRVRT